MLFGDDHLIKEFKMTKSVLCLLPRQSVAWSSRGGRVKFDGPQRNMLRILEASFQSENNADTGLQVGVAALVSHRVAFQSTFGIFVPEPVQVPRWRGRTCRKQTSPPIVALRRTPPRTTSCTASSSSCHCCRALSRPTRCSLQADNADSEGARTTVWPLPALQLARWSASRNPCSSAESAAQALPLVAPLLHLVVALQRLHPRSRVQLVTLQLFPPVTSHQVSLTLRAPETNLPSSVLVKSDKLVLVLHFPLGPVHTVAKPASYVIARLRGPSREASRCFLPNHRATFHPGRQLFDFVVWPESCWARSFWARNLWRRNIPWKCHPAVDLHSG